MQLENNANQPIKSSFSIKVTNKIKLKETRKEGAISNSARIAWDLDYFWQPNHFFVFRFTSCSTSICSQYQKCLHWGGNFYSMCKTIPTVLTVKSFKWHDYLISKGKRTRLLSKLERVLALAGEARHSVLMSYLSQSDKGYSSRYFIHLSAVKSRVWDCKPYVYEKCKTIT